MPYLACRSFFYYRLVERFDIIDLYAQHEVLGKGSVVISLKDEAAAVAHETNIAIHLPINGKAEIEEKLFGPFEVGTGGNKWFDG